MAFRLPANLAVGVQYQAVTPGDVTVLEEQMAPRSRVLVGLVFAERYDRFLDDCERAESALIEAGIPAHGRSITAWSLLTPMASRWCGLAICPVRHSGLLFY